MLIICTEELDTWIYSMPNTPMISVSYSVETWDLKEVKKGANSIISLVRSGTSDRSGRLEHSLDINVNRESSPIAQDQP